MGRKRDAIRCDTSVRQYLGIYTFLARACVSCTRYSIVQVAAAIGRHAISLGDTARFFGVWGFVFFFGGGGVRDGYSVILGFRGSVLFWVELMGFERVVATETLWWWIGSAGGM